jgi:hypothetical protein
MRVSRRVNRAAQFFARREVQRLAMVRQKWTDPNWLYSIFVDSARRVHPRQFDDIACKSAPVSAGAKAKHARARLGLYRAFRCRAFVSQINSRREQPIESLVNADLTLTRCDLWSTKRPVRYSFRTERSNRLSFSFTLSEFLSLDYVSSRAIR